MTRVTPRRHPVCYRSSTVAIVRNEEYEEYEAFAVREVQGGFLVARALRNHNVWLALTYVGLILLMARTYA